MDFREIRAREIHATLANRIAAMTSSKRTPELVSDY
jgi:hypothetical protein